ncbi:DUF3592 domain-containing protein [Micromonospora purpureochromogenes]|uniref:DUF3592 domain-containing protein n=1 Tax=Micromonospora purpureochromogenes TaxID=47872 RepID=A0ABX2RRB4_9ACTN|nr:DUF3592 domain-containing protein [Micromonospora purpureochromogenes]NYF58585.1 hypothetical protein [Micromonospora purpureochromogenes]
MDGRWEEVHPRRRNLIGALIATTVGATFMCCVALYNGTIAIGLANLGITTDATVVQVDRFQRGSKITVEFTAQSGDTVSAECTSCSSDLDEGDRVRIRYNPDNLAPGVEDAENHGARRVALFALAAVAVLLSTAGLVGWRLNRDRPSV